MKFVHCFVVLLVANPQKKDQTGRQNYAKNVQVETKAYGGQQQHTLHRSSLWQVAQRLWQLLLLEAC